MSRDPAEWAPADRQPGPLVWPARCRPRARDPRIITEPRFPPGLPLYRGAHVAGERGSVTAETAVALPAIVFVLIVMLSALQMGAQSSRALAEAGLASRELARGEPPGEVRRALSQRLPGAQLEVRIEGELVCARVRPASGPRDAPGARDAPETAWALLNPRWVEACALDGGR